MTSFLLFQKFQNYRRCLERSFEWQRCNRKKIDILYSLHGTTFQKVWCHFGLYVDCNKFVPLSLWRKVYTYTYCHSAEKGPTSSVTVFKLRKFFRKMFEIDNFEIWVDIFTEKILLVPISLTKFIYRSSFLSYEWKYETTFLCLFSLILILLWRNIFY